MVQQFLPIEIIYSKTEHLMEGTQPTKWSLKQMKIQWNPLIQPPKDKHFKGNIDTYDCGAPPIPKPTKQRKAMIQ